MWMRHVMPSLGLLSLSSLMYAPYVCAFFLIVLSYEKQALGGGGVARLTSSFCFILPIQQTTSKIGQRVK